MTEAIESVERSDPFALSVASAATVTCRDLCGSGEVVDGRDRRLGTPTWADATDGDSERANRADTSTNPGDIWAMATAARAAQVADTEDSVTETDQSSALRDGRVFAGGENTLASDLPQPPNCAHTPAKRAAGKIHAGRAPNNQYHKDGLDRLRGLAKKAAEYDGHTRATRNELLVGVAIFVSEPRFDIDEFCSAAQLPCTKATRSNPYVAVFQGALGGVDRKLASKKGIALSWALGACGDIGKLGEFLERNTIEQCLKGARAAKASPRRSRKSSLRIVDAPPIPDGRVTLTFDVIDGVGHFVSEASAQTNAITPVDTVAPPDGGDGDAPRAEKAPGGTDGIGPSSFRPAAPEIRRDDVAGGPPTEREEPAAA